MNNKDLFKALWTWITEEPSREKHNFPGFLELPADERAVWSVHSNCPACREAHARGGCTSTNSREICPLTKAAVALGYGDDHLCLNGLHLEFCHAAAAYKKAIAMGENTLPSRALAVASAKKIRDLDWEERNG